VPVDVDRTGVRALPVQRGVTTVGAADDAALVGLGRRGRSGGQRAQRNGISSNGSGGELGETGGDHAIVATAMRALAG
jgi:hypothetical protein